MDSDVVSRLGVRLDTSDGPWDEVVAFTERILNANFKRLFELYPEMAWVTFDDPDVGTVEVELEASKIIIPGEGDAALGKEVYYQICFKSGYIKSPMGGFNDSIAGWRLAIPCSLNLEEIKSTPVGKDDNNQARSQAEVGNQVFNHPGDYSVERLFAQLSTAKFNNPNVTHSTVLDTDGVTRITLKEWRDRPQNKGLFTILQNVLCGWATEQEEAGRSTLNVTFKVPEDRVNIEKPTYAPTFLYQQTYPYINPDKGVSVGETNLDGKSLNCLLWCEVVGGNTPPTTRQLPWTGNFVTDESATGKEDYIDGTFAVGHHIFFAKHLLPRLQLFNQASTITGLVSSYYENSESHGTNWDSSIGAYKLDSRDKTFEFQRYLSNPADRGSLAFYEYNHSEHDEHSGTPYEYPQCKYLIKPTHKTDTKVKVSWKEGEDTLCVAGETNSHFESEYFRTIAMTEKTGHLKYSHHITWSIKVILKDIVHGKIIFEIDSRGENGLPECNLRVWKDNTIEDRVTTPPGQEERILQGFRTNLDNVLKALSGNLNTELSGDSKFIYPGNGDLDFFNPLFSRGGNVLAEIKYKTIENNGVIHVEAPLIIKPPPVVTLEPIRNPVRASGQAILPKLTWKVSPEPIPASSSRTQVTVTATNETTEPIGFYFLRLKFTSQSEGPNMFTADKINNVKGPGWKEPTRPSKSKGVIQECIDTVSDGLHKLMSSSDEKKDTTVEPTGPSANTTASSKEDKIDAVPQTSKDTVPQTSSATPTDDTSGPVPEEQGAVGTISATATKPELILLAKTSHHLPVSEQKGSQWQVIVWRPPPKNNNGFVVRPGESINIVFDMGTGVPRTYQIVAQESWRDAKNPSMKYKGPSIVSDEIGLKALVKRI